MKPTITCLISLLLATLFSTSTLAGSQVSPPLKIIALQMEDGSDVLQLIVRRNIEYGTPGFSFNPANCASTLTGKIKTNGKSEGNAQYFDIPLGTVDHSAAEQRQLLNESFAALITSRTVHLHTRDDVCTNKGSRVVSGLELRG